MEKSPHFISAGETLAIAQDHCREAGIVLPENFESDFRQHIGENASLKTTADISQKLCYAVRCALAKNPALDVQYGEILKTVSSRIREQLLRRLGFEFEVIARTPELPTSPRMLLYAFLKELAPGESWNYGKLAAWRLPAMEGENLVKFILRFGPLDISMARQILGPYADEMLARNPWEKVRTCESLQCMDDAKFWLMEFLSALPAGSSWSGRALHSCEKIGASGPSGLSLFNWIRRYPGKCGGKWSFDEDAIREALGIHADECLRAHPYESQQYFEDQARDAFAAFLDSLPEGSFWNMEELQRRGVIGQNGLTGETFFTEDNKMKGKNLVSVIVAGPVLAIVVYGFYLFFSLPVPTTIGTEPAVTAPVAAPTPGPPAIAKSNSCLKIAMIGPDPVGDTAETVKKFMGGFVTVTKKDDQCGFGTERDGGNSPFQYVVGVNVHSYTSGDFSPTLLVRISSEKTEYTGGGWRGFGLSHESLTDAVSQSFLLALQRFAEAEQPLLR